MVTTTLYILYKLSTINNFSFHENISYQRFFSRYIYFFMCPRVENRNTTVQTLAYLTTLACFDARKIPSQILSQGMDHRMPCDSRGKKINIE